MTAEFDGSLAIAVPYGAGVRKGGDAGYCRKN